MKVRKRFLIIFCVTLFISIMPFLYEYLNAVLLEQVRVSKSLQHQCSLIIDKNRGTYNELKKVKLQHEQDRIIQRRKDRATAIYDAYVEWNELYHNYWISKKFLYDLLTYQEKYQHLAPDYNWADFDAQAMMCLWINDQSGFCNRADYIDYHPKTKTKDYWIMQMNQCHYLNKDPKVNLWRRIDKMYPELEKKPDSNVEKNVAVWYLWLEDESKTHRQMSVWTMYTYSRSDSKTIYQRVATIK